MSTINLISVYRHAYDVAGIAPFAFQRAVAEAPEADILVAPTGLGKAAAVTLGCPRPRRESEGQRSPSLAARDPCGGRGGT
jgi:hypothetical protein